MRKAKRNLLILGANTETIRLVESAIKLDCIVHVADPDPNSPAKRLAHYTLDCDCNDLDTLQTYCIQNSVEGIMVGVADRLVDSYRRLCGRLGFPSYANELACYYLTDKYNFNQLLENYGLSPIPAVNFNKRSSSNLRNQKVLVKPRDGNSGKGIRVYSSCHDLTQGVGATTIEEISAKGLMVERLMDCDDVFLYFQIIQGRVYLAASADRTTFRPDPGKGSVCYAASYPSRHETLFEKRYSVLVENMIASLNIDFGILMISAFVDQEQMYFYDPGFRLQGEAPDLHLEYLHGVSHCELLVKFALEGLDSSITKHISNLRVDKPAGTLWTLARAGRIHRTIGFDPSPNQASLFCQKQRFFEGDHVTSNAEATEGQVFCRSYFSNKNREKLALDMHSFYKSSDIFDEEGLSLKVAIPIEKIEVSDV